MRGILFNDLDRSSTKRSVYITLLFTDMDPSAKEPSDPPTSDNRTGPYNSKGWDGKLRIDRRAIVTNAEILSDPEYSDEDAPPVEEIPADEGGSISDLKSFR